MNRTNFPKTTIALVLVICVLTGILIPLLLLTTYKPQENALRVKIEGHTEVVRFPYAHLYHEGDTVSIPNEDGSTYNAVVIEPVTVENVYTDDQP